MNTTKISRQNLAINYPKLSGIVQRQKSVVFRSELLNLFETSLDASIGILPFKFVPHLCSFSKGTIIEPPIINTMAVSDGSKIAAYIIEDVMVDMSFYYA